MKTSKLLSFLCFISFSLMGLSANGQGIFGRVLDKTIDKTVDKMSDKIENQLSEKISEKIAEKAYQPIDQAFEKTWQSSFPKDTTTGEVDWDQVNKSYGAMLESMNSEADVPESYDFDLKLDVETKDYDGQKNNMSMWFAKNAGVFGMEDMERPDHFIVMDGTKDVIVMYDLKNKTAQAIPGMMKMSAMYAKPHMDEVENDMEELNIEKTGKTKKIHNYISDEFKGESETEKIKFYMAQDFPIEWKDAFGPFIKQFSPTMYQDNIEEWNGMVLKSENELKKGKKKSSYEVKKITEQDLSFKKSDYKFKGVMEQ